MSNRKTPHPKTCPRCPHKYSVDGCPFYLTGEEGLTEERQVLNGPTELRLITGCIWHEGHLMRWICQMVMAANKPAAVLQGWRNDMVKEFGKLANRVTYTEIAKTLMPAEPKDITALTLESNDAIDKKRLT